jgi:hypothetical protein
MGGMNPSKMPKAKTIIRKDDPNKVMVYAKGGSVKPMTPEDKRTVEVPSRPIVVKPEAKKADPPATQVPDRLFRGESERGDDAVPRRAKGGKAEGGSVKVDLKQDKALIKKAFRQHEIAEHGGKHVPLRLKKGGNWIQSAVKKPGALRAALGAKKGEPIPAKKLAAAAKKPGKLGQRARFAEVLKGFKKK